METDGSLTATQAKQVLADMVESGRDPATIANERGFEAMDTSELASVLDAIIAEHPQEWDGFCHGDDKARGKLQSFLTGQIMKATRGQADGKAVSELLRQRSSDA